MVSYLGSLPGDFSDAVPMIEERLVHGGEDGVFKQSPVLLALFPQSGELLLFKRLHAAVWKHTHTHRDQIENMLRSGNTHRQKIVLNGELGSGSLTVPDHFQHKRKEPMVVTRNKNGCRLYQRAKSLMSKHCFRCVSLE